MSGTHSDASRTVGHAWQKSAVLNEAALEPLYTLNWEFLTILAGFPRRWRSAEAPARLPDPMWTRLLTLSAEQLREISRSPISLFSARFDDEAFWSEVAAGPGKPIAPPAGEQEALELRLREFARLALFYAWHLALSNPGAARVILGMTERAGEIFRGLTLIRLHQIAQENPWIFEPRWPDRTVFWQSLLGDAAEKAERVDLRLLGLQILAADFDALSTAPQPRPTNRRLNNKT